MKKIFALLLVLTTLFAFASCDEKESVTSDEPNAEAVGEIKDMNDKKDESVFIPDNTYVICKETNTKSGAVKLYEYNDHGHLAKIVNGDVEETIFDYTYNDDGSYTVHEKGKWSESIREYDSQQRLIKEISEPDSSLEKTDIYTYLDNGIVNVEIRDRDDRVKNIETHTYNDKGLLVKREQYRSDGVMIAYIEFYYDDNGYETSHSYFAPNGDKASNDAVYEWTVEKDEYGRVVNVEKRDTAIGGLYHKETYEYFDEERMYKITSITGLYEYEYRPVSDCIK